MKSKKNTVSSKLIFKKQNYQLMLLGLLIQLIGFVLMSIDKEEYGFGFLGLTFGPIVVLLGFGAQFFAILYKPKAKDNI